jgi:hypothetical protein
VIVIASHVRRQALYRTGHIQKLVPNRGARACAILYDANLHLGTLRQLGWLVERNLPVFYMSAVGHDGNILNIRPAL